MPIVENISYKGEQNGEQNAILSLEGKVVQDADRLDAIGAIGIARAFAFGGHMKRPMYDPDIKPLAEMTAQQYVARHKNGQETTVNHFYEKLLKLKDSMNTSEGRRLAAPRTTYMVSFLQRLHREFEGKE